MTFTDIELLYRRQDGRPFDPPEELTRIREESPIVPMVYPDGHEGWLVTGWAEAREVLAHPEFSARPELMHLPMRDLAELPPANPGDMLGVDAPEHPRLRRLVAGKFTPRRMGMLTERIKEYTAEILEDMAGQKSAVDLMEAYAFPIPTMVICEMLGVPYADRGAFQRQAKAMMEPGDTPEAQMEAAIEIMEYLSDLVDAKRKDPTDDILSELTQSDLAEEELLGLGTFLLAAGLHTTANVIGMGTFALLLNPEQQAGLRKETAIDEILRYTGIGPFAVRTALANTEIAGITVKEGQSVTMSLDCANRDPRKFTNADVLDLDRDASGHLTFVHGPHQCLGQHLARIELRVAFPALFDRFPSLRLDIPVAEVPLRTDTTIYGMDRLPVVWTS